MLFYLAAVVPGLVVGLLRGGRLEHLAQLRHVRAVGLLVLAIALQALLFHGPDLPLVRDVVPRLDVVLVGGFLAVNALACAPRLRAACWWLTGGWALNAIPILLLGRMPYDAGAASTAGLDPAFLAQPEHRLKHVPVAGDWLASALGDRIPFPPLHIVLSLGDLALLVGAALLLSRAMGSPDPDPRSRTARYTPAT